MTNKTNINNEVRLAIIYARVSSVKQREEGTIVSQVECLKQLAQKQSYKVPEEWIILDDGFSGRTLRRPGLDKLLDIARLSEVDTILVYSPDRLSRTFSELLFLEGELKRHGVQIFYYDSPPARNEQERMMEHIRGVFADYERTQIVQRARRGRLHQAKQGSVAIISKSPFGYTYIKKSEKGGPKYILEETKADYVREIFMLYTEKSYSIAKICRYLETQAILNPTGGKQWFPSTVRNILRNPAYSGVAYFGKSEAYEGVVERIFHNSKGRQNKAYKARKIISKENWIPIEVPPIVSLETYELAAAKLIQNKIFASRNTKEPALLQGIIICGKCGSPYYKKSRKIKNHRTNQYSCKNRLTAQGCKNTNFFEKDLDNLIWNQLINTLKQPALIEREIERRAKQASTNGNIIAQKVKFKKKLSELEQSKNKLLDAYQHGNCLTVDELSSRMVELRKIENTVKAELEALEAKQLQEEAAGRLKDNLENFLKKIYVSSKTLDVLEKRRIVRLLISEIILGEDEIEIRHCVPIPTDGTSPESLLYSHGQTDSLDS